MDEDERLLKASNHWIRVNKKALISELCNETTFPPEEEPFTIFMAGTPGAGKTEFSINLIEDFGRHIVRIDADEIREKMRDIGYNGKNAELFQSAANKGVNILYDACLHSSQSAVLDGTFAYGNWHENVQRSLSRDRTVEIYYLYQDPLIAWEYVRLRQSKQGRVVPKEVFIDSYRLSIKNVQKAKEVFGDKVTIYFAVNNYQKTVEKVEVDVDDIEKLLPKRYTDKELRMHIS